MEGETFDRKPSMSRSPFFFFPFVLVAAVAFTLLLLFVFALIQVGMITVAFQKLGLTPWQAFFLLVATLLGSSVNLPVHTRTVPLQRMEPSAPSAWFRYQIPRVTFPGREGRQIIALNVGGCLIPCILSLYFLQQIGINWGLILTLAVVVTACFKLARPIPNVGIGIPFLVPPLITVLCVWLLAPNGQEPHVAFVAGSLGTLIGADLLHLLNTRNQALLSAPVLSIGGAGTFDGIFLTGIVAVLLA